MSNLNAALSNSWKKKKFHQVPGEEQEGRLSDTVAFLTGKRCLVLDDEYLIGLDIQEILEAAGAASVTSLSTAAEALNLLTDGSRFDLAVLDIRLGGAEGSMPVATRLAGQGTPFVFLTGMRAEEVETGPFPDAPVVEKPYQAQMLIEAVRKALMANK